jgi:hypothetical protein
VGGLCLLVGTILLLAYSGGSRPQDYMGKMALSSALALLGIFISKNRLITAGACVGIIALWLLIYLAFKFDGRVLLAGLLMLAISVLIVRHAKSTH